MIIATPEANGTVCLLHSWHYYSRMNDIIQYLNRINLNASSGFHEVVINVVFVSLQDELRGLITEGSKLQRNKNE